MDAGSKDAGIRIIQGNPGEALNNSSMNYQSKNKSKCDFDLFFIFNNLPVIENGDTSLCAELLSFSEVP